jgi:hypothetical protein
MSSQASSFVVLALQGCSKANSSLSSTVLSFITTIPSKEAKTRIKAISHTIPTLQRLDLAVYPRFSHLIFSGAHAISILGHFLKMCFLAIYLYFSGQQHFPQHIVQHLVHLPTL